MPAGTGASPGTELEAQLSAAQAEIEAMLREAAGTDAAATARAGVQLQLLARLQRTLANGDVTNDPAFRVAVTSAVAEAVTIAAASRDAIAVVRSAENDSIAITSAATRRAVQELSRDMYERRIFDPYLQFASAEDEAAYRQREAANRAYIDAEMAKNTAGGNLNAAGATQGQMLDAAAHGADRSPEFKERWEALKETTRKQREEIRAKGGSTEEYDQRIEASVRRFLKAKGKTDAEIDAILASSPNPLDAVEPYLESEKDARALGIGAGGGKAAPGSFSVDNDRPQTTADSDDVFSQFSASGISYSGGDCLTPDAATHGLGVNGFSSGERCAMQRK